MILILTKAVIQKFVKMIKNFSFINQKHIKFEK
jgi:hypothetical protein